MDYEKYVSAAGTSPRGGGGGGGAAASAEGGEEGAGAGSTSSNLSLSLKVFASLRLAGAKVTNSPFLNPPALGMHVSEFHRISVRIFDHQPGYMHVGVARS